MIDIWFIVITNILLSLFIKYTIHIKLCPIPSLFNSDINSLCILSNLTMRICLWGWCAFNSTFNNSTNKKNSKIIDIARRGPTAIPVVVLSHQMPVIISMSICNFYTDRWKPGINQYDSDILGRNGRQL